MADEEKERITLDDLSQEIGQAIIEVLKDADQYSGSLRSRMVLDAAHAYRALRGGPQPGSVVVAS